MDQEARVRRAEATVARRRSVARASRWLGSRADAEDLVHDVWLRLASADETSRAEPSAELPPREALGEEAALQEVPDAWWYAVLRNASIDRLRRRAMERRAIERAAATPGDGAEAGCGMRTTPDAALDAAERTDELVRALVATSSPAIVAMVLLRTVFDYDFAELARAAAMAEPACRQAVHRALVRAREALGPRGPAHVRGGRRDDRDRAGRRRRSHDDEALLTLCRSAIAASAPAPLHALLPTSPRAAAATSLAPHRASTALTLVGGRYVLALVLDGVVLCALPVGPCEDLAPEALA